MTAATWQDIPGAPAPGTVLVALADLGETEARLVLPAGEAEAGRVAGHWPGVIVVRDGERLHAFLNRCPHFQAPLARQPRHLLVKPGLSLTCNAHYARFDWHDGRCLGGECEPGEGLLPLAVTVDADGRVRLAETPVAPLPTADRPE